MRSCSIGSADEVVHNTARPGELDSGCDASTWFESEGGRNRSLAARTTTAMTLLPKKRLISYHARCLAVAIQVAPKTSGNPMEEDAQLLCRRKSCGCWRKRWLEHGIASFVGDFHRGERLPLAEHSDCVQLTGWH